MISQHTTKNESQALIKKRGHCCPRYDSKYSEMVFRLLFCHRHEPAFLAVVIHVGDFGVGRRIVACTFDDDF